MAVNNANMFWAIPIVAGEFEAAYEFYRTHNVLQPIHPDAVISTGNLTGNTAAIEGVFEAAVWVRNRVSLYPANLLVGSPAYRLQMLQAGHLLLVLLRSVDFPAYRILIS